MFDAADISRPERRSALIAHELARLIVDVAALGEVCFPEVGSLKEHGIHSSCRTGRKEQVLFRFAQPPSKHTCRKQGHNHW